MADAGRSTLYFENWVAGEGLDLITGYMVKDIYTIDLKPWARIGGNAVQIQLDGTGGLNAAYVCEIAPGKELKPQKHLYEELTYILQGNGSTVVWCEGGQKNSFEWQAGSMFCIPLNASYQHFNGSGSTPARYVAVTTAPIMMNLYRNDDFIFQNDAVFPERYSGQQDYFSQKIEIKTFSDWDVPMPVAFSNFFPDINAVERWESNRGVNARGMVFEMANGVVGAHTVEVPGGTFTKIHRHGPGAHVIWLKGEGYSLMWPDGGEKVREDWGPGSMLVPPAWWWHQHGIVSNGPAQHLALKLSSMKNRVTMPKGTMQSVRNGGSQMDYEDFPPALMAEVKKIFVDECTRRGTTMHMEPVSGL